MVTRKRENAANAGANRMTNESTFIPGPSDIDRPDALQQSPGAWPIALTPRARAETTEDGNRTRGVQS